MADRTLRQGTGPGRLLVALALALALTGCGSDESDSTDTPDADAASTTSAPTPSDDPSTTEEPTPVPTEEPTPEATESPTATVVPEASPLDVSVVSGGRGLSTLVSAEIGASTERVTGKLIIAKRGCLHLANQSGPPTLLVLPPGAELDTVRKPTLVLDGARYPVGRPLSLTGASVQLDPAQTASAKPCTTQGEVFRATSVS